jgi:hypothetical protein
MSSRPEKCVGRAMIGRSADNDFVEVDAPFSPFLSFLAFLEISNLRVINALHRFDSRRLQHIYPNHLLCFLLLRKDGGVRRAISGNVFD